jgi:FkbM family methyltransferase
MYPFLLWTLLSQKIIRSDGKTWPWPEYHHLRKLNKFLFRLGGRFVRDVEICDRDQRFRFRCANVTEFGRCMKMFVKETGTCNWIRENVKPGEVFYDIGANIGIYSLLAAERVGRSGKVYSFEPHSPTFVRLIENVSVNRLEGVIEACNFALHEEEGFFPFVYASLETGTSESQLSSTPARACAARVPSGVAELKFSASIDGLVTNGGFAPPCHVKIDVDGNELFILRGMKILLKGNNRPKSIQVEINKDQREGIVSFMAAHGFHLSHEHRTRRGSELVVMGDSSDEHAYNVVFEPSAQ